MTIGIYTLYWEEQDLVYIGQSINIEGRFRDHISLLNRNKHYNYKIQNAFNSYSKPKLIILEICQSNMLDFLEGYYIQEFDSFKMGLNILPYSSSNVKGINNPASKYTKEQLIEVFHMMADDTLIYRNISKVLNISESTIYGIAAGDRHVWLQEEYPNSWKLIKLKHGTLRSRGNNSSKILGKTYPKIISPDGTIFNIESTTKFCIEHFLDCQALYRLFKGKVKTHKGWKLYEDTSFGRLAS